MDGPVLTAIITSGLTFLGVVIIASYTLYNVGQSNATLRHNND